MGQGYRNQNESRVIIITEGLKDVLFDDKGLESTKELVVNPNEDLKGVMKCTPEGRLALRLCEGIAYMHFRRPKSSEGSAPPTTISRAGRKLDFDRPRQASALSYGESCPMSLRCASKVQLNSPVVHPDHTLDPRLPHKRPPTIHRSPSSTSRMLTGSVCHMKSSRYWHAMHDTRGRSSRPGTKLKGAHEERLYYAWGNCLTKMWVAIARSESKP